MLYGWILAIITGYLLGSMNTSILVSTIKGNDIRQKGSGNAGATNTLRTMGVRYALIVLVGDALKGIAAFVIGSFLWKDYGGMLSGVACVMGHNFPLYFKFKGGKGIATSAAAVFMLDWRVGLALLTIWLVIIVSFKYVSLGSVIAAICIPIVYALLHGFSLNSGNSRVFYINLSLTMLLAVLAVYMHRGNLVRLINKNESKLTFKKGGEKTE